MQCNVGKTDRIIRGVAGLAIIIAGIVYGSWFGAIGLVLLGVAAIGWCPAYVPFKINTVCKDDSCNSGGCCK